VFEIREVYEKRILSLQATEQSVIDHMSVGVQIEVQQELGV
jgi:hypothetical protein